MIFFKKTGCQGKSTRIGTEWFFCFPHFEKFQVVDVFVVAVVAVEVDVVVVVVGVLVLVVVVVVVVIVNVDIRCSACPCGRGVAVAPALELPKVQPAREARNTDMFLKSLSVFRANHLRVGGVEAETYKLTASDITEGNTCTTSICTIFKKQQT